MGKHKNGGVRRKERARCGKAEEVAASKSSTTEELVELITASLALCSISSKSADIDNSDDSSKLTLNAAASSFSKNASALTRQATVSMFPSEEKAVDEYINQVTEPLVPIAAKNKMVFQDLAASLPVSNPVVKIPELQWLRLASDISVSRLPLILRDLAATMNYKIVCIKRGNKTGPYFSALLQRTAKSKALTKTYFIGF
ncbi:hypothetical protein BC829DRAFT_402780 [Chytridium lagenaria]|nr:hypothetical protein BC829DRAFT_402780 [Chytridium lagenaria]